MIQNQNVQIFKSIDIFELRDRAHLIVFTEQKKIDNKEVHNYQQEELDKFKSFCSFVETIYQTLRILNRLSFNGYPDLTDLKVEEFGTSIVKTLFTCSQSNFQSLKNFKAQLEAVIEKWNECIINSYVNHYELTYLKGKNFWKVEMALNHPEEKEKYAKGHHLLHYIGKSVVKSEIDFTKSPQERLDKIGEILKSLPNIAEKKQFEPFEQNYMFYIVEIAEKAIIKGLLTLYLTIQKSIPSSFQVLLCHSFTSWNELVAIAYRCFFNPDGCLFCLIQPERLSFSLQDQFSSLIKDLNNQYPNKAFNLAFVTTNKDTHLVTSLKVKNQTKIFKNAELLEDTKLVASIKSLTQNCKALTSSITGLGKTASIQKEILKNKLNYYKIPISGTVDPISIGKRLLPILSQERPALCFVLGSIAERDKSLLNEILFSMTVLKSFHYSKNVIELPNDLQIYFEIDSSYFESLKDDIEIFGYLNCYNIDKMEWKYLDYLSPKIQFVCHYLKALADRSLGKKDIFEEDIKDKILDLETCFNLLTPKFLQGRDENYASYTQLKIFIDVLYSLFKSFSYSGFFLYSILSESQNQREKNSTVMDDNIIAEMRLNLVEGLILAADQYTSKSVETVRSSQKYSMKSAKAEMLEKANNILSSAVVTWENSKPFTIVFTSDDSPIFVYRTLEDVPKAIKKSVEYQAKASRRKVEDCLPDYKTYEQTSLTMHLFKKLISLTTKFNFGKICQICFKKSSDSKCQACNNSDLLSLGENHDLNQDILAIQSSQDYALTPDNFIKMLLIFMRAQQKIPIIIMGETGCGKTSLVRYLCTRILDDEFRAFSIHAGITSKMIVDEVTKYVEEARIIQKNGRKVWVFFDEFNTTESIGLIKEIICERTMLGIELPENMVFLGACNPWRLKTQRIIFDENVGIKKKKLNEGNKRYNLLYTVHPLPETMIEFVWDYGYLDEKTEQNYIEAMIQNLKLDTNGKKIVVELVSKAQRKFKESEDVSSVSLRDVARYKILYGWFLNSLKTRSELNNTTKINEQDIQKKAIVLSLLHCYYLRISSRNLRAEFLNELNSVLKKLPMTIKDVEELLYEEEMDFLRRMEPLPDGIARNQALRENVFALVVCIFNKIPIFICGKPGCSKSLAIQLVFNNLRGKNSSDPYFKTLPELILVSYQGSEYCTSDSILGVFNRAEKYLSVSIKNKEILPVIVFDEIGLAEISENNPLKVLHNKLEIENIKVGFVGISNWRLDASKMNRALYLARPDPDMIDLKFTAEAIYESIRKDVKLEKKTIEALAKIYCDLKKDLKENQKEDMFGLRDYYFLIKGITFDLVKFANNKTDREQKDILYHIVRKNLKKNFSGIGNEHEFMWEKFCVYMGTAEKQHQIAEPSVRNLIIDNLKDKNSRYLMIIIQSDCATEYIEQLIMQKNVEDNQYQMDQNLEENELDPQLGEQKDDREIRREVKTLIGSQMPDDLKDQSYGFKVLSDIILYMEKGYTLIFKKTDHLYSSLYDLFNQSFSSSGDKRYCRVALGALYNPKCLVHRDFHCVIFITENEAKKADPPFLNRFEKYKLKVEDILTEGERILKQELEKWVNMIIKGRNGLDLIRPESVFVNYNSEHLFNLIMKAKDELTTKHKRYNEEVVLDLCKRELIKAASFDFPITVSLNLDNEEMKTELLNLYYQEKETTFKSFCDKIFYLNNKYTKNIIYTYTQISDDIEYPNKDSVKELKLGNFKSETEILEEVTKYFDSHGGSLLVIRIELSNENQHLLFIKHLLLNSLNAYKTKRDSHLMLIIHLQRFNAGTVVVDTLFQDWESVMIDDLNSDYLLSHEFLENPQFSKLVNSKLVPKLDDIVNELFDKCLSKIRHNVDAKDQNSVNNRRNQLLVDMKNNSDHLLELIKSKTLNTIAQDNNNMRFIDWRKYIIEQEWVKATAISSLEAMRLAVCKYYESYLMKIVYILEKDFLLDSYFLAMRSRDENILKIWNDGFEKVKITINQKLDDQLIEIEFIFGLNFPFSVYEQPKIIQIQEEAEELAKKHEPNLLEKISLDNLRESSFFGEKLSSEILGNEKVFTQYFDDQLLLHLRRTKFNIKVEFVSVLLDYMFMGDQIAKLQYFLTSIKELNLILGVLEALFTLPKGHLILTRSFKGFLNLSTIEIDKFDTKDLPRHLLVFKDGFYYTLRQEELTDLQNAEGDMNSFNKDDSKRPFIYFLFGNIIEEISCCDYLSHFESINQVKSVFKLIEEKIIKTKFLPDNLELFRPWIDLMLFIQNYDVTPNKMFKKVLAILQPYEKEGLFTTSKCIQKLVEFLKKNTEFVKNLNMLEKERKILKLQTQLYKNLISLYTDEFFQETFELMDKDPDLWKFSAKIVDLLDDYTVFTPSISDSNERIDMIHDVNFGLLEDILKDSKQKLAIILINKAFITLETQNHLNYRDFLSENFDSFKQNVFYFVKSIEKWKSNDQEKDHFVPFLGVTVWLKVYLYFYSIALERENNELEVLKDIDDTLCQNFPGLSTLKLYVIKNLKFRTNKPFKKLREEYLQRVVNWIKPFLVIDPNNKSNLNIIPLLEIDNLDESKHVDDVLKNLYNLGESVMKKFLELCANAKQDQKLLLCIFCWFMRLYINNLQEKFTISQEFIQLLTKHEKELSVSLGDMGIKLILLLLRNFDEDSYFHLHIKLTEAEVYQKVAALSVLMIFISQQFSGTALSSFMFKDNRFPESLSLHLNDQCLFGQLDNNFIVNNMKDVKIQIEERLRNKAIYPDAKFIYKCGPKCEYFFYFDGCGRPTVQDPKKFCIVCGEEIGASAYDAAFPRHQKMTIEEGFKYIDDYIQKFDERAKKGYLLNQMAENCKVDTKGNLKPITFRTLHFLLHTALLGLYEARFITKAEIDNIISIEENIDGPEYFKKHFLQDYKIIGGLLGVNDTTIWLYKVLLDFKLLSKEKYEVNNVKALAELEKVFEERIILPAIQSVNTVIQDYTKRYIEYSKPGDEEDIMVYIDELKPDSKKFPVFEYFNYMKNPTFDDFHNQFCLLVGTGTHYPLLSFVLNKHKDLSKISSLPVIVEFTNYLKKKFDFRISREKATITSMKDLCKDDPEMLNRFNIFKQKWNELEITSVRVGCQEKKFQQINEDSSLSLLLPNTHKDESGILLVGAMIALANLQNEFIYVSRIGNDSNRLIEDIAAENKDSMDLIQTIKADHTINISRESILMDVIKNGYIHNYEYGKGKEIIYDFEEIESKLYEYVNGKKLLDNEKFLLMNYQFELYPESASIITDIRRKNPQKSLNQEVKIQYKKLLKDLSKKDLIDYLGSLDYVFTYLCNVKDDVNRSLEEFCRACISNYQDLNKYVIKKQPFSKIQLNIL